MIFTALGIELSLKLLTKHITDDPKDKRCRTQIATVYSSGIASLAVPLGILKK